MVWSHSLLAVHTTAAHNHSYVCPFGKAFRGDMAVMVSLALLALLAQQDLQGYQVPLEHPVWRQLTYDMSSHPLQTHPLL